MLETPITEPISQGEMVSVGFASPSLSPPQPVRSKGMESNPSRDIGIRRDKSTSGYPTIDTAIVAHPRWLNVETLSSSWVKTNLIADSDGPAFDDPGGNPTVPLHGVESSWTQSGLHQITGIAQAGGFE